MKTRLSYILSALLVLFVVVACTSPEEPADSTEVADPTDEPTSEPTGEAEEPADQPLVIEDGKLYVAIIWHQHQPVYFKNPETGIYEKPWVRVHATKDYLDMAAMLENYPDVKATFNITPSLIRQLDDLSAGTKDLYWVMAEVPAEELTDDQKQFILNQFFDTNRKVIARFPRYQELLTSRDSGDALVEWTAQDFRDLQVLFNLAWTDPDWLAEEPLAGLVAKGRDYTEEDKVVLFEEHLRIVKEVIPFHAQMQQAGQIEITMTPFAHPILPLLVDSDLARTALPDDDLPTRFVYGQDAVAQVQLGVQFYEDHFGAAPRGMWPAEGSVAQQVVSMIAGAGIQWIATDEDVLAGSLADVPDFTRDSSETVQQADVLYRPYAVEGQRGGPVAIFFRDKTISDKVGFTYSGMSGDQAARDFISRLENIQARLEEEGAAGPNLVTVLLDGENAWEYYDNDGKDFLNGMYQLLSESEDIVTVTPSEYLAALEASGEELARIDDLWPGSWIDGTYSTWIGEEEENIAWEYLRQTREALQDAIASNSLDDETLQTAMTLMYIAEGSDWFWWYGADQNSGSDDDFDAQYRAYLKQIYETIGQPVPSFVYVPVIPQSAQSPDQIPLDLLEVTADGVAADGEWDNAGYYTFGEGALSSFYYGFNQQNLFLRMDIPEGVTDGTVLGVYFGLPEGSVSAAYSRFGEGETLLGFGVKRLLEITFEGGVPNATVYEAREGGQWRRFGTDVENAAVLKDGVLEVTAPFAGFAPSARSGDNINMRLVVSVDEADVAVLPGQGPALATVPDLPIPNIFAEFTDPRNDDYGPGTYTYPTDGVFKPGVYDVTGLTIGYDEDDYIFRVQLDGSVDNGWGAPNGMGTHTIDIYIDVDGPENGDRLLLPGRNAAFTADYGWDYAVWAEGWTPGIYTPGPDGPVQIDKGFTIITNPGQQRTTIRVPRNLLPDTDPTTWKFGVAVMSQEGYPSGGVWRVRDVQKIGAQWRLGGGTGSNLDTRIFDILVPEGFGVTQEDLLANPSPGQSVDLETLSPDDYPQAVMVAP